MSKISPGRFAALVLAGTCCVRIGVCFGSGLDWPGRPSKPLGVPSAQPCSRNQTLVIGGGEWQVSKCGQDAGAAYVRFEDLKRGRTYYLLGGSRGLWTGYDSIGGTAVLGAPQGEQYIENGPAPWNWQLFQKGLLARAPDGSTVSVLGDFYDRLRYDPARAGIPLRSAESVNGVSLQQFARSVFVRGYSDNIYRLPFHLGAAYADSVKHGSAGRMGLPTTFTRHNPTIGCSQVFLEHGSLAVSESGDKTRMRFEPLEQACDSVPYNFHRWYSSHNAYVLVGNNDTLTLEAQLELGVRSVEIDVDPGTDFAVNHRGLPVRRSCRTLGECLRQMAAVPTTEVVTLFIQLNDTWHSANEVRLFDDLLRTTLGDRLITPAALQGLTTGPSRGLLPPGKFAEAFGWPRIGRMRGGYLVVITTGEPRTRQLYLNAHPEQCAAFVAADVEPMGLGWKAAPDWAAFVNVPFTPSHGDAPPSVEGPLFALWLQRRVTRAWKINDQDEWNEVCGTYCNHLAADLILGSQGLVDYGRMTEKGLREPFYDVEHKVLLVSIGDQSRHFMDWDDPAESVPARGFGRFRMTPTR